MICQFMYSQFQQINTYYLSSMSSAQKAGCYGLVPGVSDFQVQTELPLKRFTYDVELAECLAYLQTQQTYYNDNDKVLDVQYIFPVNPNSAIVSFEISFGGNATKGVIKSKQQAQRQFNENLSEGREVGYGGYNSSSKDVLKVKLGNISPKQEIKVKLCYVHPVSVAYNIFYQFRLSTTITPRYVCRLDQQLIQFVNPNQKTIQGKCQWFLKIKIKSSRQLIKIFSTTHQIKPDPQQIAPNTYEVVVSEANMKPNKDFALYYTFNNFDKPVCMLSESDYGTQAIISFVPKFCNLEIDDAKKKLMEQKEFPVNMSKTKGEYIFFLDRSGSMGGDRIEKAKQALVIFLKSLPENSYFNIVSFGSQSYLLFPESKKYELSAINESVQNIKKMDADLGGTEILQAIKKCMQTPLIEGYTRQIFLLTDGSVSNTTQVISYAGLHTQFTRYNCIGIGNGCSQDLIINCAARGKGHSLFISDSEDPSDKIIEILERSLSPVITKMEFELDHSLVESIVPNPKKLPFVLKNQLANFFINFNGKLTNNVTAAIKYTDTLGNNYSQKILISPQNGLTCDYIGKMVSFSSISTLYNAYKYKQNTQEHVFFVKEINKDELEKKIIKESIQKQILTELTAFICVDASKADQITKAIVKNAKQSVSIKPMNPLGHQLQVKFGPLQYQFGSDSDIYVDECCLVEMQMPESYQSKQNAKNKPNLDLKRPKKPFVYFNVIDKSNERGVQEKAFPVNQNPIRQILQVIEKQQVNGMWNNDELLNRIYSEVDLAKINKTFQSYTKQIKATLAIIKFLERFFESERKKVTLILRKAREFIQNNIKGSSYDDLSRLWSQQIREQ